MAFITLDSEKLTHNYQFLRNLFDSNGIKWGIVTKLLCGNEDFIKAVLDLGIKEIHDSRISNLKKIKEINPAVQTVYIKPPAKRNISNVIEYADASMNTEYYTMRWLSEEAVKQGKEHKVIIMIETGDLREGVMGESLINFYHKVFELPNINIVGLCTNLNCLHGVMPSQDKLVQLSLYKQIIELKFNKTIPWVSGGTSVTIPLVINHQLPRGVNHFRVGETLYFGANLFDSTIIEGMHNDVFNLYAEVIEINRKPMVPIGEMAQNPQGQVTEVNEDLFGKTTHRAILDIGLLDIDPKYFILDDHDFEVVGASSDMIVLDLGANMNQYKVGDLIKFKLKYMGALSILNSSYIEKKIV
jgi:predicted amino acid racemase